MAPPLDYRDFDTTDIGVDEAEGRYAEVSIERCKHCGRQWLRYCYEISAFSKSNRWYRGLVTPEQAERTTAGRALEILAGLSWHLYGGSYYETSGKRSDVPLNPNDA